MVVVIPMAGRGTRFQKEGYSTPKPFIPVLGELMVIRALASISNLKKVSRLIFVCLKEHQDQYNIHGELSGIFKWNTSFVFINDVTQGQLCTVLKAEDYIMPNEGLLICSSDTYIESDIAKHIENISEDLSGLISVINLPGDNWSFAKVDSLGKVIQVAEKQRISEWASTGIYFFSKGSDFLKYSKRIIDAEELTRGEYYVIPVYQKMIEDGHNIGISIAHQMWDMGTPNSKLKFENFLANGK